jgi:hypothetical protein
MASTSACRLREHVSGNNRYGHVHGKKARAVVLIELLIRDGVCTEEVLASEMVIRPRTLVQYRDGTVPVPLERQLCLALFMTRLSKKYARMGYALRDQVRAAGRFEARMAPSEDCLATR